MQFIDYLKRLKNIIIQSKISNDVIPKIENNKKVYRLHYLYFNGQPFEEMHDCACDTFAIPENFSENDAFKVISYFFNNTEYEIGTYYCCCATTEKIKSIGFKQIDNFKMANIILLIYLVLKIQTIDIDLKIVNTINIILNGIVLE